jgi:hypothetical protein
MSEPCCSKAKALALLQPLEMSAANTHQNGSKSEPCSGRSSPRATSLNKCNFAQSSKEARHVALNRLIFAEARRRHQQRCTYKQRASEQNAREGGAPTLWRLSQSATILREVLQDVLAAVKSCSAADFGLKALRKSAIEHEALRARVRMSAKRQLTRLSAVAKLRQALADTRAAESDWQELGTANNVEEQ